jgi:H+/Cl- antiporter ClcA
VTVGPVGDDTQARAASLLRSRRYIGLLIIAALLGVPISAIAYGFLHLVTSMQGWVYTDLPKALGLGAEPLWWPVLAMAVASPIVWFAVARMPGGGGEIPIVGFHAGPPAGGWDLPGIALAAIASIGLGAVVGPEAPLIALGGGLALLAARAVQRNLPQQAAAIVATIGSFAAISTLLGSPLIGAFLLMEVAGLGGAVASAVLVPGLLGAGVGALIFTGIGALTGEGPLSLTVPDLPPAARPTFAAFGWALVVGVAAALVCWMVRLAAHRVLAIAQRRALLVTLAVGLVIAGLAIAYREIANHTYTDVLFSGEEQLPDLLGQAASYSVGALVLLVALKSLAYAGSLAVFRGGPVFPSLFIGAAGGIAMSHLPGLDLLTAVGMGIGAMSVGMLRLPMTSALLATLLLGKAAVEAVPLIIVAVVVTHVISINLSPPEPASATEPEPAAAAPRPDRSA